jgi:thioredoxin reductase
VLPGIAGSLPNEEMRMTNDLRTLPVAVIGAGPIGLAAAAHLVERGFTPLVLEAGEGIAANLESYRHVTLFSPWRYNVDPAARRMLDAAGWLPPPQEVLPTAGEMIDRYLAPLCAPQLLGRFVHLRHRVRDIAREGMDKMKTAGRDAAPFVIRCDTPSGPVEFRASAVIDASGTWGTPNPLGANGLPARGEREAEGKVAHGMPDILGAQRARYAGKHVVVAGAGHSAAGDLLALAKLAEEAPGTRISWLVRGRNFQRIFGGGANDGLPARGALGSRLKALAESGRLRIHDDFRVQALRGAGGQLVIEGRGAEGQAREIAGVDEIIVAAGGRPDLSMAAELRVKLDPWVESTEQLAPLIDPNQHSCGTVRPHGHRELAHPEKGYYAVGAKSYGRAPNFLLATGHEQVRSVVAALAGDMAAADAVQLELPETGVCSTQFDEASSGCCGGPPVANAEACCALDESSKAKGEAGCAATGCGDGGRRKPASVSTKRSCCA